MRHYLSLQRRDPTNYISAEIMMRLIGICCQLCADNRQSEALEVAGFRTRLLPLYCGVQSSDLPSNEEIALLCSVFDMVDDCSGAATHSHRHIDIRTIQFQSRLLQSSTTAEELDLEAMDLVSCYGDVDYPSGERCVLQLLLTWKSERKLAFAGNHVELVRSLESRTGELLPLADLDSIPSSQHLTQRPPLAPQTNVVICEGPTRAQPARRGLPINGAIAHSRTVAQQPSSSARSQNPFSRFIRFVKGDLSEERLSASGPLSPFETIFLSMNVRRSISRGETHNPALLRKLQVLSERMPYDFREAQPVLRGMLQIAAGADDPVQAIEEAEATLRAYVNHPISESWVANLGAHFRLGCAHHRLSNPDKSIHHFSLAGAAADNAPPQMGFGELTHFMETLQFFLEHRKKFQPGRDVDPALVESTQRKVQQLLQTSPSGQEKMLLTVLLESLTHFSENSLSKVGIGIRLPPMMDAPWDLLVVITHAIRPAATQADVDVVRQKLETFEKLRGSNQTLAKSLAFTASSAYFCLGCKDTTRARETDPPSIELLHQARISHQAAMGALEYVGVEINPMMYVKYMCGVGDTWELEGDVTNDPTAYQSALQEFGAAEEMFHESRGLQEPTTDDMLQKLMAKQQFVGQYNAISIFGGVFRCCWMGATNARNETQRSSFFQQAWELIQRRKSRSLLDVMALNGCIPASMLQTIRECPDLNALLQEETRLIAALSGGLPGDRPKIRNNLQTHRKTMKQHYFLNAAMRARDGDGLRLDDLCHLTQVSNIGTRVVFVDWFTQLDQIFLFAATTNGLRYHVSCHRLGISESAVSKWARSNLKRRVLSNNEDAFLQLKKLKDLIAPLKSVSGPDDLLVLCPTTALHHIPLHALEIDDDILLKRNPIVYVPSLSIFLHQFNAVERARAMQNSQPWRASVMSVYGDSNPQNPPHEVAAVRDCMSDLASALGTTVQSGPHVTVPYFQNYVHDTDLIHFHGHAVSGSSAENQALVLQPSTSPSESPPSLDHHLTARSIFTSLTLNRNPLVINIACNSGSQEIKPGDEPFGLTTAFLFAGANTVIGTLWPIKSADGRSFTKLFYGAMSEQTRGTRGAIVDVARAVQQAALVIEREEATEAPYHWASFVVCGLSTYPLGGEVAELRDSI
jgi:CHAT domain-containing protein